MAQDFAAGNLRQTFFDFLREPIIIVNEALNGFPCERLSITSLFRSKALKLCLNIGVKGYVHIRSLVRV